MKRRLKNVKLSFFQLCNCFDFDDKSSPDEEAESKVWNWSLNLIKSNYPVVETIESLNATGILSLTIEAITGFRVNTRPENSPVENLAEVLRALEKLFSIPQILSSEGKFTVLLKHHLKNPIFLYNSNSYKAAIHINYGN